MKNSTKKIAALLACLTLTAALLMLAGCTDTQPGTSSSSSAESSLSSEVTNSSESTASEAESSEEVSDSSEPESSEESESSAEESSEESLDSSKDTSASEEFNKLMDAVKDSVFPGTAGSTLSGTRAGADLASWYASNKDTVSIDDVVMMCNAYISGLDDPDTFTLQLNLTAQMISELPTTDGQGRLTDCGWEGEANWTEDDCIALSQALQVSQ